MLCRDLMKSPAISCSVDDTAARAAAVMRTRKLGFLPVCDSEGRVVGTVTDRDLTVRVLAECFQSTAARLLPSTPLRLVMTHGPVTCAPHDDLTVAEERMRRYHKSRIICVDENRKPLGVISLSDIARGDMAHVGELLREITEREVRS